MSKITFIKSPTGQFGLAYGIGESADLGEEMNQEMMEANFAIPAKKTAPKKETATAKHPTKETRSKK